MPHGNPKTAIDRYAETMDALAAETQRLCDDQPEQQAVRTTLLRAEKHIHRAGWDQPPQVFHLQRHIKTGRMRYIEFEKFSRMIIDMPGLPSEVLGKLAGVVEFIRQQAQAPTGELHPALQQLPDAFRDPLSRARRGPDGDLFGGETSSWRFHGVGFAWESWMILSPDENDRATARQGALHTHPQRIETRQLSYSARDGWNWEVRRLRRTDTIAVPRHCTATNHDSNLRVLGGVPHALTRMCNAIASNTVPVMPTGD